MTGRIQRKRVKGWRSPDGAVYCGRGTVWGNPFTFADAITHGFADDAASAAEACVRMHAAWLEGDGQDVYVVAGRTYDRRRVLDGLPTLRGRTLSCWCAEDAKYCHVDNLRRLSMAGV